MSKQKKSGALTIADIVNAVGVVLLGIACFLGYNYSTLGNLTISLVAAILIMGISYGIIQFIAYAKMQDSFFMKWRIIEYGGLFTYVLVVVFAYKSFAHFGHVEFDRKEYIKELAHQELVNYQSIIGSYEKMSEARIAAYNTSLMDMYKDDSDGKILCSLLGINKAATIDDISNEIDSKRRKVLGDDFNVVKSEITQNVAHYGTVFSDWNRFIIPVSINNFEIGKERSEKKLEEMWKNAKIAVIERIGNKWTLTDDEPFIINKEKMNTEGNLKSEISNDRLSWGIGTIMMYILIQLFIVLKYMVAPRTRYVRIKKKNLGYDDGGAAL